MDILIVEDDPILAELCGLQLQRTLHETVVPFCIGSLDRVKRWLNTRPAQSLGLVLLDRDIVFGHDGLDLIGPLRNHPAFATHGRIVIWTSHDDAESITEARDAGADGFLTKTRSRHAGMDIQSMLERFAIGESWVTLL